MARKRKPMRKGKSKRDFRMKSGVHPRNRIDSRPMRGGIRL